MMKKLNMIGSYLAMTLAILSLYLWNVDGAWDQGQLSTKGLMRVLIFAGVALLLFGFLKGHDKK